MDKFQALYIINKSSKKYRNIGGKRNQDRTHALYGLKHELIRRWLDEFEQIEIHDIDGDKLLYFRKGEYGYHAPKEKFNLSNINISESKKVTDFYSSPVNSTNQSERQALEYIKSNMGLNINSYLPEGYDPNAKWALMY